MKKFFTTFITAFIATIASAQFVGDGYYRVQNLATERYLFLTDNTGSYDKNNDTGDLSAIQLWKNKDFISDPSSIIYIYKVSAGQYDLTGQGSGVHALTGLYANVKETSTGSGEYQVYGTYQGFMKYLSDNEQSSSDQGQFSTVGKGDYRLWYVYKVDNSSKTNYFGLTPNVSVGTKHYYPLFMAMPFTLTGDMKAYVVSKVDNGMAVIKPITGTIPAFTPVIVECTSTQAINNKLNLVAPNTIAPPSDNLMKGQLFCNQSRATNDHTGKEYTALTRFDANTMRVLGVTSAGKLGFVSTSSNLTYSTRYKYDCLPANQAYLPVASGTNAQLTIVTEAEYQAYMEANATYTITYTIDGQTYTTQTYKKGESIKAPTPTREGYTFTGWSNLPSTMPGQNITVSGSYSVNKYTLTYVVDGTSYQSYTVAYGTALTPIAAPTKEGYTFSGWSTLPATMPARDVTITGSFSVNSYTITYVLDGQTYTTQTVAYGTALTPIAAPTKEGHTFSGWSTLPATMPAKDITVTGSFSVNSYTLTYVVDGQTYKTQTVVYGTKPAAVDAPTKEGYTFTGWSNLPATMPASNVTATATFTVNSYTLTYVVDGQTYTTQMVAYGTKPATVDAPTKEGYTFAGWSNLPATMPASDVTATATFTVNSYTVSYYVGDVLVHTVSVAYGETIPTYTYQPEDGDRYVFMGWISVDGATYVTMPAHDVTYTTNLADGISSMPARTSSADDAIYDLSGRRLDAVPQRGAYIRGGKLYISK